MMHVYDRNRAREPPSRQTYSNYEYSLVLLTAATPSLDEGEAAVLSFVNGESSITLKEH